MPSHKEKVESEFFALSLQHLVATSRSLDLMKGGMNVHMYIKCDDGCTANLVKDNYNS